MVEQWRDIAKWDNLYQVSNFGRIKRKSRVVSRRNYGVQIIPEIIIEPIVGKNDYMSIKVVINNKLYRDSINGLVSTSFNPEESRLMPFKDIKKRGKISMAQQAELIEIWVNNPNISIQTLADNFGITYGYVSYLISNTWFFKHETAATETITLKSSMDDEIELGKTA